MIDLNDYGSWSKSSKGYAQLNIVGDMNNLGSHELKHLDTMNNLGLWTVWLILCDELMVVDDMNDFRSWA